MRIVSRPPPHPFPLRADCVPFELVVSAGLLGKKNCGGGGSNSTSNFHHHDINGGAVSTIHDVTGRSRVRVIYSHEISMSCLHCNILYVRSLNNNKLYFVRSTPVSIATSVQQYESFNNIQDLCYVKKQTAYDVPA
jgi:hypothetical protein